MAEINIERRPERSPWPIVLAVLAVLAIAVAVWYYTQQTPDRGAVEVQPTPADTTVTVPPGGAAA